MSAPVQIACVMRSGGPTYNARYVNALYNGFMRNSRHPLELTVLTDSPVGINPAVRVVPLEHDWVGWWSKIELFRPGIWQSGRVWYFDLDTIIIGDVTEMLTSESLGDNFYALNDPLYPGRLASGTLTWMANDPAATEIYTGFIDNDECIMSSCSTCGDQCWIGIAMRERNYLQDVFPNKLKSFKRDCPDGRCVGEANVVYFHGQPRPHQVAHATATSWVRTYWR